MISVSYVILNSITRPKSMKCQWMSPILSEQQLIWFSYSYCDTVMCSLPVSLLYLTARSMWPPTRQIHLDMRWPWVSYIGRGNISTRLVRSNSKQNFYSSEFSALCTCPILLLPIKAPSNSPSGKAIRLRLFCHWIISEYTSQILYIA